MTVLMSEMTWPEYVKKLEQGSVVILPVGSLEQHAYHMPLGTDTYQAFYKCKLIAEKVDGIVAPPITYGYKSMQRSGGGQGFPGTTSLSANTLILLVKDILKELIRHGADKIVLFDGHYENSMFLHEAIDLVLQETTSSVKIIKVSPGDMSENVVEKLREHGMKSMELEHAGLLETSLMLYLRPELVKMDKAKEVADLTYPSYDTYPEDPERIDPSGALSNPTKGSAELGELMVKDIVDRTVNIIKKELC